ncbi:hypothetical protein ACFLQ5_00395 [Bacteroidota bacterium]
MNGYWDKNLNWIEGKFSPQHFEMIDLLNLPELACPPDFDIRTNFRIYENINVD